MYNVRYGNMDAQRARYMQALLSSSALHGRGCCKRLSSGLLSRGGLLARKQG